MIPAASLSEEGLRRREEEIRYISYIYLLTTPIYFSPLITNSLALKVKGPPEGGTTGDPRTAGRAAGLKQELDVSS